MTIIRHRSSVTGRLVTKRFAQSNPTTTEEEKFDIDYDGFKAHLAELMDYMEHAEPEDVAEWQVLIFETVIGWGKHLVGKAVAGE
jgi:hypothetical protein